MFDLHIFNLSKTTEEEGYVVDYIALTNEEYLKVKSYIDLLLEVRTLREKAKGDKWYQQGRTDVIDECKKIVMAECTTTCEYSFLPDCIECMCRQFEQLKE